MTFFDQPDHRPPSTRIEVGESVTGTLSMLKIATNMRGEMALVWAVDGGPERWANKRLWRAMADSRVDVGDRITITRGPDEERPGQAMAATTWTVERGQKQAPAAQAVPSQALPAW